MNQEMQEALRPRFERLMESAGHSVVRCATSTDRIWQDYAFTETEDAWCLFRDGAATILADPGIRRHIAREELKAALRGMWGPPGRGAVTLRISRSPSDSPILAKAWTDAQGWSWRAEGVGACDNLGSREAAMSAAEDALVGALLGEDEAE